MADGFQVIGLSPSAERGAAAAAACLADEVAIDFPSLGAIRDRMRRTFFGGEGDTCCHSAEIRLTPHEAFLGARVSLAVPVSATCASCGGRGEVWMDPCLPCEGTGAATTRHQISLTVPAGVRDGTRFRFSLDSPSAPPTAVEICIAIR